MPDSFHSFAQVHYAAINLPSAQLLMMSPGGGGVTQKNLVEVYLRPDP